MQAGVDPGSGARAGDQVPLVDEQHLAIHPRQRKLGGQLLRIAPVGGTASAVQQPRRAEHECSGTHRQHEWGFIRGVKDAWTRLGNGEQLRTNAGVDRLATFRCMTCEDAGPLTG